MLDRKVFNRCMSFILMTHDIQIDEDKNNAFYGLMKNDFTDDEFKTASERVCKEETLYNKYPTPPMFYKHKKTQEDELALDCEDFLNRVEDYLRLNFVPTLWKQEFIDGLNDIERRCIQSYGGISTLWSDCHRDDMPRSISNVLKDLRESFNDIWVAEVKVDNALEYKENKELADKTKNLLNCLKKCKE